MEMIIPILVLKLTVRLAEGAFQPEDTAYAVLIDFTKLLN